MKIKLKPHGTKRLKLSCDILLSIFGFKFNSRRYNLEPILEKLKARAYTRSLLSST
jgi:hypothetical protein